MSWLYVPVVLVVLPIILFATLRPKLFTIILKTLPRDLHIIWIILKASLYQSVFLNNDNSTPAKLFRRTVRKNPKKIAIYFEEETWTFEKVDRLSNNVGHYFKSLGYQRGDTIALLMDSRPEYICMWLGLAKIGVVAALINTNVMARDTLAHAVKTAKSKAIIFGSRFRKVVGDVSEVMPDLKIFQFNYVPSDVLTESTDLSAELEKASDYSLDSDIDDGKIGETLLYVYTSGTTGLPKASIIKNVKFNIDYIGSNLMADLKKDDIIYIPVPLYHMLGGGIGVSQCLINGNSIVLKTKFSASSFWRDCENYKCTVSLYIGEMVRYIILAHQDSKEKPTYRLKKMFGNGMKPTTCKKFREYFNVDRIIECYGSTEGNFALFNLNNKVGSVGYLPTYADFANMVALVKCNETGEPIRNEKGFCELCEYDYPGLLVFRIWRFLPVTKFTGYLDKEATKKKVLKDVLRNGDRYFNTGDILVQDDHGYFYFKDRTGDTFRWKSENVSTSEVEGVLSLQLKTDVAVYGVEIPGSEGKAGMATIDVTDNTINLIKFLQDCKSNLPPYAVPVFIRLVDGISKTGTFKFQKTTLQKEGFDISVIKDKLYFLDPREKKYIEVNSDIYDEIVNCKLRI